MYLFIYVILNFFLTNNFVSNFIKTGYETSKKHLKV